MPERDLKPAGPDLWEVIAPLCAAASIGGLAAMLGGIRQVNPEIRFAFDAWSALSGVAGAIAGWSLGRGLWRLGRGQASGAQQGALRRRVLWGLAILGGVTCLGFAWVTFGLPDSRRSDVIVGAVAAVLVVSGVGVLVWRLIRAFGDADDDAPDPP